MKYKEASGAYLTFRTLRKRLLLLAEESERDTRGSKIQGADNEVHGTGRHHRLFRIRQHCNCSILEKVKNSTKKPHFSVCVCVMHSLLSLSLIKSKSFRRQFTVFCIASPIYQIVVTVITTTSATIMKRPQAAVLSSRNVVPALIEPDDFPHHHHDEVLPLKKRPRGPSSHPHLPLMSSPMDVLLKAIENVSPGGLLMMDGENHSDTSIGNNTGSKVVVDFVPSMTHEMIGITLPTACSCAASVATTASSGDANSHNCNSNSNNNSHNSYNNSNSSMDVACLPPLTSFSSTMFRGRPLMCPPKLPSGLRPGQIMPRRATASAISCPSQQLQHQLR